MANSTRTSAASVGAVAAGRIRSKNIQRRRLRAAAAFNKKVKVLFLGIASMEGPGTKTFSEQLTQAGIKNVYYESPGTAHEWLTWRRCFKQFAPLLFH
jgi:enterochelin esterase family protein